MTPQAQRIAIAQACGWTHLTQFTNRITDPSGNAVFFDPVHKSKEDNLPDYLNSLDAVTAAARYCSEHVMDADQWEDFGRFLVQAHPTAVIQDANGMIDFHDLATLLTGLTAAQYAECLLKAIGKWTE